MELRAFLMVLHLLSTLLMAAPFYMLAAVTERGRAPQQFHENIKIGRETWQAKLS